MGVGRAAMGSLIDSLENRGWVERHPKANDRRVWLIAITPSGAQAASLITKIDERLREELREGISRKERRELNRLLNRLRENVERVISAESE
jgi:DNA-binding MarR family transcriptional regulator